MNAVTAAEMRGIESRAVEAGDSLDTLKLRAASALVAECARLRPTGPALVLVGPGNNGRDGLIAAEILRATGRNVRVYAIRRQDYAPFSGAVQLADTDSEREHLRTIAGNSVLIVDALLGIGQTRPLDDQMLSIIAAANPCRLGGCTMVAVDVPTGVNTDTGAIASDAFRADVTVSFGAAKLGTLVYPGAGFAGEIRVASIGLEAATRDDPPTSATDDRVAAALFPARSAEANKGSSGRVVAVCGSRNFSGAPVLVALAAYRAGAGLVQLVLPERILGSVASHALGPIYLPQPDVDGHIGPQSTRAVLTALQAAKSFIVGSGMGFSDSTVAFMRDLLRGLRDTNSVGGVLDADALNAVAKIPDWSDGLADIVVTPHPGEMSRLTGMSIDQVQSNRISIAGQSAERWGVTVVLKGARTIVASPNGQIAITLSGGPNLATAGTGDVLSGVIAGLLAQGASPWDAARCGAYIHGRAGDLWRAEKGDVGMLAEDLLDRIPVARQVILKARNIV